MKSDKKPELMAPASDLATLNAALKNGADSVYFGLKKLNMRAKARNFSISQLPSVIKKCHKNNVKAYLTLNTIVYPSEKRGVERLVKRLASLDLDGVICWDFSIIQELKKNNIPFSDKVVSELLGKATHLIDEIDSPSFLHIPKPNRRIFTDKNDRRRVDRIGLLVFTNSL